MHCTHSCTQQGATVPCIKINRISHTITQILKQYLRDSFLCFGELRLKIGYQAAIPNAPIMEDYYVFGEICDKIKDSFFGVVRRKEAHRNEKALREE